MPRPNIIRADTHDLQTRQHPTAAAHEPQVTNGVAPSQAQALRAASAEQQAYHSNREDELERELADAEPSGEEGFDDDDDDDLMEKMSSSPSIPEGEEVNQEFVYALHTFTATVEGQANAIKGDHMLLLDDSNSYWWLVRIVRTDTVGYLPAEHIEMPNERLARYNKHRNAENSSPHLVDQMPHASRNPLKRIRSKKKGVQFTNPTSTEFVDAPEYKGTDGEEDEEGEEGYEGEEEDEEGGMEGDEGEPLEEEPRVDDHGENRAAVRVDEQMAAVRAYEPVAAVRAHEPVAAATLSPGGITTVQSAPEPARTSEEGVKLRPNPTPAALRHPDSAIFHDDTAPPKKLTLTPNLLRDDDDVDGETRTSVDQKGHKSQSSMDSNKIMSPLRENAVMSPPPNEKGKRGRKGSVLGGLFKRRGKKGRKEEEEDVDDWLSGGGKQSLDSTRSGDSGGKMSEESFRRGSDAVAEEQRKAQEMAAQQQQAQQQAQNAQQAGIRKVSGDNPAALRLQHQLGRNSPLGRPPQDLRQELIQEEEEPLSPRHIRSPVQEQGQYQTYQNRPQQLQQGSPYQTAQQQQQQPQQPQQGPPRPSPLRKVSGGEQGGPYQKAAYSPSSYQPPASLQPARPALAPANSNVSEISTTTLHTAPQTPSRLSESPEQITFHDAAESPHERSAPSPHQHSPSTGTEPESPVSPLDSTPELIERSATLDSNMTADSREQTITRTWSDWSLKTYFEDDEDVRDMLIVVKQDKGETGWAGGDAGEVVSHPGITPLFEESRGRLQDLTKQLDGMLGEWLQRTRAARA